MIHTMLATRSTFSLGESILSVDKIIEEAQKIGAKAVAITDTMSVSALIDFSNAAKKAEIKPIIGVRLRLVDDPTWRKTKEDKKARPEYFMTAYVLSEKGLQILFKLLTHANAEDRFYEVPRLGFADLYSALDDCTADDLCLATGDTYSVIHHAGAGDILREIVARVGVSNALVTLNPINTPLFDTLNAKAIKLAQELELKTIVTRPVFYEAGGDMALEVLDAICSNEKLDNRFHYKPYVRDFRPLTDRELAVETVYAIKRLGNRGMDGTLEFRHGLVETENLVNRVTYTWKKFAPSLPKMAPDEDAALVEACKVGWLKRFGGPEVFGHRPSHAELAGVYKQRLTYELRVLKDLKFAGYFLLVADIVQWSKSNGIMVGPGRGSVGGSLVAYLMGITETDPLRFGLLFERFINPGRLDLPDADLDFMSTRRHEVIEYIRNKFGADKFGGVSNYGTIAAASALIGAAKAHGLPDGAASCSRSVPKEHGQPLSLEECIAISEDENGTQKVRVQEIADFYSKNETVFEHAQRVEGCLRSLGQHAAGIVVSGVPIAERCAIEHRKDGAMAVNWDKRTVEDMGLVKMDILGLSTLDTIAIALRYIWERHTKRVEIGAIPIDDEKVLAKFAAGETVGIFQFESGGMRRLLKDLGSDGTITFGDITAATALYRPGPMDSGMMEQFVNRKRGFEHVIYDHPNMEAATKDTYGVAVYQEQIMQIARDFAGFSLSEADNLRKAMGKKDKDKMAAIRDQFVQGAVKVSGVTEPLANQIFDKIEVFAGYGFNLSHAVEYTLISYQAMWLKTYYAVEFLAAALTIADKDENIEALVGEAQTMSIQIISPDINLSSSRFEVLTDTKIAVPFNKLLGISDNTSEAILAARAAGPFTSKTDFLNRVEKRKCNAKHQDILERVGAFARIEPTTPPANHPDRIKDKRDLMPGLITDQVIVHRSIAIGPVEQEKLSELMTKCADDNAKDGVIVKPHRGKKARFMVVADCPSYHEEQKGEFCIDKIYTEYLAPTLDAAGLTREDAYWTGLLKRQKESKSGITKAEIDRYLPVLQEELKLVKPPLIITLGSFATKHFLPDIGKPNDNIGKVVYSEELDANILVGFSPSQIFFDGSKLELLAAIFQLAANILT